MATVNYRTVLEKATALTLEDRLRLIKELEAGLTAEDLPQRRRSIMELCGLGQEVWRGVDAQEYVNSERATWNG